MGESLGSRVEVLNRLGQPGQDMRQETGQDDPYDEICNACVPFCGFLLHKLSSQAPWQDAKSTQLLMPNPFHNAGHLQGESDSGQLPQEIRSHLLHVGVCKSLPVSRSTSLMAAQTGLSV